MRRYARYLLALAIAPLLGCLLAPVAQAADAPIQFVPADPLVVSWAQLQKEPFTIAIQNLTTASTTVQVELGDLALRDTNDAPLQTADVLSCKQTLPLTSAGVARMQCSKAATTPDLLPGSYTGSIAASITAANVVVLRPIRLVVEDTARAVPTTVADSWSTTLIRPLFGLGGTQSRDFALPIRSGANATPRPPALVQDGYLGFLATANGHGSAVTWTGTPSSLPGGLTELRLRLPAVAYAGKYEGAIDLNPADDKAGAVKLTVMVTDLVIWPILALAVGIALALAIQRYLGVQRTVWRLREDAAYLREALEKARWHFADKARGQTYAKLDLATDANAQLDKLRVAIDALPGQFFVALDTKGSAYTEVINARQQVATAIAQWETFADDLLKLRRAITALSDAHGTPPPAPRGEDAFTKPAFLNDAETLLTGGALRVGELAGRHERVGRAATLAKLWPGMAANNQRAREEIGTLLARPDLSKEQRARLHDIRDAANRAWYDLWDAQDADDLARRKTAEALIEVEERLAELRPNLTGRVIDTLTKSMELRDQLALLDADFGGFFDQPPATHPAETAHHYAQLRRRWDGALTVIALVIALWTGLNALYIGKPFGTVIDYANALCWGITTKVALDAAASILEKVLGGGSLWSRTT